MKPYHFGTLSQMLKYHMSLVDCIDYVNQRNKRQVHIITKLQLVSQVQIWELTIEQFQKLQNINNNELQE